MKDYAIRTTAYEGEARAFAARTTHLVNTLQQRHHSWPIASAALGRTVTVGAMMGMMLKNETDQLTIQIRGDGPLGSLVVDANPRGEVRGYVQNPHVHLPANAEGKLNVGGGIGKGTLNVVKDLGLKEPYRGSVELVSGELAEDFACYFTVSEQTPSAVAAGVLVQPDNSVSHAGGFIVQMLPGARDETIERVETGVRQVGSVTDQLLKGKSPEDILEIVLGEPVNVQEELLLSFRCRCSRERIENMLKALGRDEIQSLLEEQGEARVQCHFCNETYTLSRDELKALL